MIEHKIIGWLETVSNRRTDRWMGTAVDDWPYRRPWMRSAVILPETRMGRVYVLRTLGIVSAFNVVMVVAINLFGLVALFGMEIYPALQRHGKINLALYRHFIEALGSFMSVMGPIEAIFICLLPVPTSVWLLYRAYFWNRRALRLRANPVDPNSVVDSRVWPPPPRIS